MRNIDLRSLMVSTTIALVMTSGTVRGDDIDIYLRPSGGELGVGANVMFTLDWRPNLSSTVCQGGVCQFLIDDGYLDPVDPSQIAYLELLRAVLKRVVGPLAAEGANLNLGLAVNHEDAAGDLDKCADIRTGGDKCENGAMILKGFEPIANAFNPDGFFEKLDAIPIPQGNAAHKWQQQELFFELFRYFTGQNIMNAHNGWQDWGTDDSFNVDNASDTIHWRDSSKEPTPELVWDCDIQESADGTGTQQCSDTNYIAPSLGACGKLFTVNLLFQTGNHGTASNDAIVDDKENGGMPGIDVNDDGKLDNKDVPSQWSAAGPTTVVLDWLNDVDLRDGSPQWGGADGEPADNGTQNVTSFFLIDHDNNKANDYAEAGGTGSALRLSDDPDELIATFEDIFDQILAVSSTFVSPDIPVSTINRLNIVPESFLALFNPDADDNDVVLPFWAGGIKKLRLHDKDNATGANNQDFELRDANNIRADALDGRIKRTALTFWTHKADVRDTSIPADADYSWEADGRSVRHGGTGGVIPGYVPPLDETTRDDNETAIYFDSYSPGLANVPGTTTEAGPRKLFTDDPTNLSMDGLIPLDADNNTAILLLENDNDLFTTLLPSGGASYMAASAADKDEARSLMMELIAWMRGLDAQDGTFDNSTGTWEWHDRDGDFDDANDSVVNRRWFMGDPLHSRPLGLNYGALGSFTETNPLLRIVAGDNGGHFHMFRNNLPNGNSEGVEAWAFVPREIMATLKRLKDNTPGIEPVHPYTVDGSPSAFVTIDNATAIGDDADESMWVYFGLRRGGNGYYAFDVTDPDAPVLMWERFKDDASGDFTELAQSWSIPTVRLAQLDLDGITGPGDAEPVKVMVIGGGFNGDDGGDDIADPGELDPVNHPLGKDTRDAADDNASLTGDPSFVGGADHEGNAIFVINAETGDLIWKAVGDNSTTGPYDPNCKCYPHAEMVDSIPSIVTVVDTDGTEGIDRGYVGDTGGRVWRVDMESPYVADWTVTKLLEAGRHNNATKVHDRRFFTRPAVAPSLDLFGAYDGVVIASGDRPHPLGAGTENWLYVVKDRGDNATISHGELEDRTDHCLADGNDSDCVDSDYLLPEKGYKIRLEQCDDLISTGLCGEKGLASPLIVGGEIFISTYVPQGVASCSPKEGIGLGYRVDFRTGAAVFDFNAFNPGFERFEQLRAPGIPAESVPIGRQILKHDLDPDDVNLNFIQPTFWYEVDRRDSQ